MIPLIVSLVVLTLVTGVLGFTNRRLRGLTKDLQETLQFKHDELLKARGIGDRLLTAHEELTKDGLTPQKVEEAIRNNTGLLTPAVVLAAFKDTPEALQKAVHTALTSDPDLFAEAIDVDHLLAEAHVTHDWKNIGMRQIKVPKDKGKGAFHFVLMTDMCKRCRMEHQYFRDGGHPSIDEREGFFIGGKRIEIEGNQAPTCLAVFDGLFGSAKDVKGA